MKKELEKVCGKEISDKSKFCGYCGAKTVEQLVHSQPKAVKESIFSRFHFCKSDLITLWKVVENPFQGSELSFSASVVIVVLNLIANILILRCIICGMGLAIAFVGSIYMYCYLNRREGKKPEDIYCDVAKIIFAPTVLYYSREYLFYSKRLQYYGYGQYFYRCHFVWVLFLRQSKEGIVSQHTLGKLFNPVSLLGFRQMW